MGETRKPGEDELRADGGESGDGSDGGDNPEGEQAPDTEDVEDQSEEIEEEHEGEEDVQSPVVETAKESDGETTTPSDDDATSGDEP